MSQASSEFDMRDIPDHWYQTYPWAPSYDPKTVLTSGPLSFAGLVAHFDDVDYQRQGLLFAKSTAAHLPGWTGPSRCLWSGGSVLLAIVLSVG